MFFSKREREFRKKLKCLGIIPQCKVSTKKDFLQEVKLALCVWFTKRIIEFEEELHIHINGQMFIIKVQKFDPRNIPPFE